MAPALIYETIELDTSPRYAFSPVIYSKKHVSSGEMHLLDSHVHCLTPREVEELNVALEHFKQLGLDGPDVDKETFPLPSLGPLLQNVSIALHDKLGYFILRGHNATHLTPEDSLITFLGVSSYIGNKRGRQDVRGSMIKHIKQAKSSTVPQEDRPSRYSTKHLPFHTDGGCDILAMQVRSCPSSGGRQLVASMSDVYDEVARTNPSTIEVLTRGDWHTTAYDTVSPPRPILFLCGDQAIFQFHPSPMTRTVDCIKPTKEQLEALRIVEQAAQKHKKALAMQAGDMSYINNFSTFHSRESFEDTEDEHRHLIRLWLKNERLAYALPESLKITNDKMFDLASENQLWQVRPVDKMFFKPPERLTSPS